jgi:HPt (histidine-containing phosphotransfer) domain-containing protein
MPDIVDFARLKSFAAGDPALEAELSGLFVETATRYLDELGQQQADARGWSRIMHSLKGAAGNFGAMAMAELAKRAEQNVPDAAMLAQLQAALAETKATLERHLL